MDRFKIYSQGDILALTNHRDGEVKLGESVQVYLNDGDENEVVSTAGLNLSSARYVLLGIPEDVGVSANLGVAGTKTAWPAAIKSLLNSQSNPFLVGDEILVLGHFEIDEPADTSLQTLRNKTNEIDALVYPVIEKIVAAGKIPIVIGGGHNNALPIISGTSMALNRPLNVINIDAHADLGTTAEGRHSGNGFSYAIQHGYLNQYHIFGLQQNYVSQALPAYLTANPKIKVCYFEELLLSSNEMEENWTNFITDLPEPCGLEIDLDSIENVLSSAVTSSGFKLNDIRKILLSNRKKFSYLHICEGAVTMANGRTDLNTGKTIAYLITDFIKALQPHTYPQP